MEHSSTPSSEQQPRYAQVLVDEPARSIERAFTYDIPPGLKDAMAVGSYVLVPFGRRRVPGYVVGFATERPPMALKQIAALLSDAPLFGANTVALCEWIAEQYHATLVDAVRCAAPRGLTHRVRRRLRLRDPEEAEARIAELEKRAPLQARLVGALRDRGDAADYRALRLALRGKNASGPLRALIEKGLVAESYELEAPRTRKKRGALVRLAVSGDELASQLAALDGRAPRQASVLREIAEGGGSAERGCLRAGRGDLARLLGALQRKGMVTLEQMPVLRAPDTEGLGGSAVAPPLTTAQREAGRQIIESLDGDGRPVLVQGITGSGKTEVYLHAIAEVLDRGRQAILLVPEIALTPQMLGRLRARFGERLAVLHSALSAGERYDEWRRLATGRATIAVGARSAVFAPLDSVGIIVIDEEHETAYKQGQPPRYDAREVARKRAEIDGALLVLGSATPSLEAYHDAMAGRSRRVVLPERIDERPLPTVHVVDMREETKRGNPSAFSPALADAMRTRLERDEQIILFLNRRGYSTFVMCRECGFAARCPDCVVSYTFHSRTKRLLCHHCGRSEPAPDACPNCEGNKIGYIGLGTEKVEDQVRGMFPLARPLRMDRDVTRRKGAYGEILRKFADGRGNILIGTQMVAKGLDFPDVTLVGVVNADTALHRADFRAGERTFQLLTQVAGRAGRGEQPGEVFVQTYNPTHYAIVAAVRQDYEAFAEEECTYREELGYPPYGRLVGLVVTDSDDAEAGELAERVAGSLEATGAGDGVEILGPAQAPLWKLRGTYRYHVLAKAATAAAVRQAVSEGLAALPAKDRRRTAVDADPVDMT
ncbi:MAG: primosomal protein N' [Armatimonadota bacterium]|jgi:primosomal protein N' (replication factor Y)